MPKLEKSQKTVLISGATGGIGKTTALLLARKGYRVFAGYRTEARGAALLLEAEKEKLPLSILPLDITRQEDCRSAVEKVIQVAGRIDILINNAGYGLGGPFEELPMNEIRHQFDTNVFGQIMLTQAALPWMRKERSGRILFLSSVAGRLAFPFFGAYCASKHALEAFGEALRYEMKGHGISVSLVEPGMIKTDFVQKNLIITGNMKPDVSPYYATAKKAQEKYWAIDRVSPGPDLVARAILRIINKRRPRLYYQVAGTSLSMVFAKRFLPAGIVEFLTLKSYGLK